jgi:hypothetical protein
MKNGRPAACAGRWNIQNAMNMSVIQSAIHSATMAVTKSPWPRTQRHPMMKIASTMTRERLTPLPCPAACSFASVPHAPLRSAPRSMSRTGRRGAVATAHPSVSVPLAAIACTVALTTKKQATATMPAPARNHHIGDTLCSAFTRAQWIKGGRVSLSTRTIWCFSDGPVIAAGPATLGGPGESNVICSETEPPCRVASGRGRVRQQMSGGGSLARLKRECPKG